MSAFRRIFITGATGAIGGALADSYAAPGVELLLHGRNEAQLAEVAARCQQQGASVRTCVLDLTDTKALMSWLQEETAHWVPDLFIANAGMNINTGPDQTGEPLDKLEQLLDLNVKATLLMTRHIAGAMKHQGHGQIGLMSSLAAFYGLPVTPGYSASKAAVKAFGEGMRGWLAPYGVGVSVIMPGYVASDMCHAMPGPKPWLWQPAQAAARIKTALEKNKARVSFPFPLNWGCWWLAVLPSALVQLILRRLNYSGN